MNVINLRQLKSVDISSAVIRCSNLAAKAIHRVQIRLNAGTVTIEITVAAAGSIIIATAWIRWTSTALTQY